MGSDSFAALSHPTMSQRTRKHAEREREKGRGREREREIERYCGWSTENQ